LRVINAWDDFLDILEVKEIVRKEAKRFLA
jgi:hypothetical protein